MPVAGSRQFVEQRLHLFGIGSVHPVRSPRVDTLTAARVRERIASLPPAPVTRFVVFESRAPAAFRRFLIRAASRSCRRYFTLILTTSRPSRPPCFVARHVLAEKAISDKNVLGADRGDRISTAVGLRFEASSPFSASP
jgi:hypothetical protein